MVRLIQLLVLAGLANSNPLWADPEPSTSPSSSPRNHQPETGRPASSAEWSVLDRMVGAWNLVETHFDERGSVTGSVKGTEVIAWTLEDRWLRRTYSTVAGSTRYQAVGMLSWILARKRYEGHWYDTASTTGASSVEAEWDADAQIMTYSLSVTTPTGTRSFRVIEEHADENHRSATTYEQIAGRVIKRMQVTYHRAEPCPASNAIRVIGLPGDE